MERPRVQYCSLGNTNSAARKVLAAAGVTDVEAAAKRVTEQDGAKVDHVDEMVPDMWSGTPLVSTMAMTELGVQGPSEKAINALIEALKKNRNPAQAALVLGGFGPASKSAVPSLLPYLGDRVSGANVIQAMGSIGAADDEVIAGLKRIVPGSCWMLGAGSWKLMVRV